MSKKLTYEFIKEQFERAGYELLSKEYRNNRQKLEYICSEGHQHNISWSDWHQGNRCKLCGINKGALNRRHVVGFIRLEFAKDGYKLLTKQYINARQKLNYICPEGHKHSITWANWSGGKRCPYCFGNAKKTIEFIRKQFEEENYILLTSKYDNNRQKLDYVCPNGHKHSISWDEWAGSGNRCPYCVGVAKPTIEFIRSEFAKENYKLLSTEYVNSKEKLEYICSKGHRYYISWNSWQQGQRCLYCAGVAKLTIEFVRSKFKKEDYILLSTKYINAFQKLDYICPNGHKHSICWHNWYFGKRCPRCAVISSKGEIEVRDFIKSLGINISANDRNQIFNLNTNKGLELDIFMPMLNKAVEYNGEYWHKDKNKDLFKQKLCEAKMIDLLTIWENEWLNKNKECKNKIKKFIFNKEDI